MTGGRGDSPRTRRAPCPSQEKASLARRRPQLIDCIAQIVQYRPKNLGEEALTLTRANSGRSTAHLTVRAEADELDVMPFQPEPRSGGGLLHRGHPGALQLLRAPADPADDVMMTAPVLRQSAQDVPARHQPVDQSYLFERLESAKEAHPIGRSPGRRHLFEER